MPAIAPQFGSLYLKARNTNRSFGRPQDGDYSLILKFDGQPGVYAQNKQKDGPDVRIDLPNMDGGECYKLDELSNPNGFKALSEKKGPVQDRLIQGLLGIASNAVARISFLPHNELRRQTILPRLVDSEGHEDGGRAVEQMLRAYYHVSKNLAAGFSRLVTYKVGKGGVPEMRIKLGQWSGEAPHIPAESYIRLWRGTGK